MQKQIKLQGGYCMLTLILASILLIIFLSWVIEPFLPRQQQIIVQIHNENKEENEYYLIEHFPEHQEIPYPSAEADRLLFPPSGNRLKDLYNHGGNLHE